MNNKIGLKKVDYKNDLKHLINIHLVSIQLNYIVQYIIKS